ncbi:MFS general substrate transporter [Ophiobolus disseminans]|uniref:MFS general substrate transporter n=1 Tax=Ophiobolus disseminans TaxID=1469910 RepID=A0A6A7A6P7_9PLEO|nr:MFS general substrate transporter [Ophiobolus disseminans]
MDVPLGNRGDSGVDNVVDWEGEGDRTHPFNWPKRKKALIIGCLFLMSIVSPFTSSVIAPALPNIMIDYKTSNQYLSSFVLSVYVLGYAAGPLLISPLSELYGRVPLYHICNVVFTICTWRCAYSTSLRDLAILRFFAGVGSSSVFALVPSSIADMVVKEKRGAAFAVIAIAYNLGPALSPTAGSYINAAWGWKWIFHVTAIMGGAVTLLAIPLLWETYEPVLLRRKAQKQSKSTGNPHLRSRLDVEVGSNKLKILSRAMVMPLRMLLAPSIVLICFITAVGYGWLYILYSTLPVTFLTTYGWAPKKIGLAYLGAAVGNLIGMVAGGGISDAIVKRKAAKSDHRPENRLLPMIFMWPLVGVGLIIYGWTAHYAVHWIGPMIGTAIFGAGAMSAIFFTGTYIVDAYPLHSASGMAASSVLRSLIGGLAPLFATKLYQKLNVGWAFSLLAFISLAFAPIPWVCYRYGEKWRRKERVGERTDVEDRETGAAEPAGAELDSLPRTNEVGRAEV